MDVASFFKFNLFVLSWHEPARAVYRINLGVNTTIDYDTSIEKATRNMPKYANCIGHVKSVPGVQEIQGRNISGVHMLGDAETYQ